MSKDSGKMSSSPEEAPPSNSPPSNSSSSSSSPPPPSPSSSLSSPPPPPLSNSSSPSPPSNSSSPPPPKQDSSPPPPSSDENSPPPPSNDNSPPSNIKSPPPPKSGSPPPSPPRSPPPPRSHNSGSLSPPRSKSSPSSSSRSNNDSSNSTAIIAGVTAGAGLLLFVMILSFVCCARRKKRKRLDQMQYYRDNSHGNINNGYYNSGQHGNWNHHHHQQSIDHNVKLPPPPGSGRVSSELGWPPSQPPPPPPPMMMTTSEMNSMGFSGPRQPPLPPPHPGLALGFNKSTFSYDDLAAATGGFNPTNLLGQGGFGYVYKGVLPNGKEVAVKSLKNGSGQGEREFQAEVDIISRVHHRHLVSLVGYCIAGNQRMLVYEFVPNSTLEFHLHESGRPTMDWPTRLRIALGSAKGFAYLHEDCHPRIIHRDIKAANILLDSSYEAKVADFGLAKLSADNYTHVSTRIMGTFGYLAPEYASSGKLSEKSDVYSYGIMLLELITGRRPVDVDEDDSLVDWARPILLHVTDGGSYEELVDPRLKNNYDIQEMSCMVACAAACIRHSARRRPKMSQIVRALEGDVSLEDLHEGVKPGHSAMFGSSGSSEYDVSSYHSDTKRLRKPGLSSEEFSSSEHGATGEFANNSGGESQEIRRMRNP